MERTSWNNERTSWKGASAPSPLALKIVASPLFTSDADNERDPLFCGDNGAVLFEFVEAAAVHLYAQDDEYWRAADRLDDRLTAIVVGRILDALELVGISDEGVKAEICRVVIKGGRFLDGKGFMEGRPVETAALTIRDEEAA